MSDPYGYGSGGGYPPQQQQQDPYGYSQQQQYPGHQQPPYQQQQQPYGAPQPYAQYGPPATGGFQHHQQATPYSYEAYNSQQQGGAPYGQPQPQQPGAYGTPNQDSWGSSTPQAQFPQQGAYNQGAHPGDPNNPYQQQNGGPEGERGLMGALAGGAAGWYGGGKAGHSVLGALAGAWGGHKLEDKFKQRHDDKPQHGSSHHGSSHNGSSYGGSGYGGRY